MTRPDLDAIAALCRLGIHNWLYVGDVAQTVRHCQRCNKVQTCDHLLARERGG